MFAFEKLPGLPRDRIVEAIAPVLRAHGLAGVELIWRTDGQGRVLQVTIESAEGSEPGGGVTLDVCSKVSRDLSTALDVLELIDGKYRLEVGSPGLERRLYTLADYRRFLENTKPGRAMLGDADDWDALNKAQSIIVGSPDTVYRHISELVRETQVGNLLIQFHMGSMRDDLARKSMRLFATEVAPRLREDSLRAFAGQSAELVGAN